MDWVALDLSGMREALLRWKTMEERGQLAVGFHMGATGAILMGGEPAAYLDGYERGQKAREESEEKRERVAEVRRNAANARWNKRAAPPPPPAGDAPADAPVDANALHGADAKGIHKTRHDRTYNTPLTPQGEPGGDLEQTFQAIWDRVAVPRGFPAFGPWDAGRRAALAELLKVPWDQPIALLWSRAVDAMAADEWARSEQVNADYLLRPPRFRRHLDAWRPKTEAPRLVPRREPPPTPSEVQERAQNRMILVESFPPTTPQGAR